LTLPELLVYIHTNATKIHTIAKAHAAKKMRGPLAKEESSAMATNTPLMASQMNAQAECDPLNAIFEIAAERTSYLAGMKKALEVGDDKTLKHFAHKLCGMPTPAITSVDLA
jgi:hypothetical protein